MTVQSSQSAFSNTHPFLRLGIFSYVPAASDAAEAGARIREWGFGGVKIHRTRPDDCLGVPLTAERCRSIRRGYESNGVEVVAFAAYRDLATADAERRAEARRQMIQWIRWAPELGARLVCSEATVDAGRGQIDAGSADGDRQRSRDAQFQVLVDEVGALESYARAADVVLALEPSASTPLDTVERALALVRAVDSPHLRLIFDPANLMTVEHLGRQQAFYAAVLDLLRPFLVLAHAKDFVYEGDAYQTPAAGTGLLDWATIFGEMLRVGFDAPVILEHLTAEQVPAAREYLRQCFTRAATDPPD